MASHIDTDTVCEFRKNSTLCYVEKIHHSIILYIFVVGDLSPTKMRHFGSSWKADFAASTESFGPKNAISMAIYLCPLPENK